MLFSKVFYPVVAILSVATSAFAAPSPAPAAVEARSEVEARQLSSITGIIGDLESALSPILGTLTSTVNGGGTSSEISGILGTITSLLGGATGSLGALGVTSIATSEISAVVSVSVNIILSLVVTLSGLPILNLVLNAGIDVALTGLLGSLESLTPGITSTIGSAIPVAATGLLAILQLTSVINLLGLGGLLGGLLGLLGL